MAKVKNEEIENIDEESEETNEINEIEREESKLKVEKANPDFAKFMKEMNDKMDKIQQENKDLKEALLDEDNITEESAKDILKKLKGEKVLTLREYEDEKHGVCYITGFDKKYGNKEVVEEDGRHELYVKAIMINSKLERLGKELTMNTIFDLPKKKFTVIKENIDEDPIILGTTPVAEYKATPDGLSETGNLYGRVETGEEVYNVIMNEKRTYIINMFNENVEIDTQAINF